MRSHHWSSTPDRDCRTGFTLLETLMALALSALLLAAIYSAIDQSWRTSASGREEMERAQLARALIHKIETDIRSITFTVPQVEEEAEETGTTTTSTSPSTSTGSGGSGGGSGGGATGGGGGSGSGGSGGRGGSGSKTGGGSGSSGGGTGSGTFGLAASTSNSSTTTSSTSTETTTTEEETGPNSRSIGIRGNTQRFEISIARPRRDLLPGMGTVGTASRTSDLRQVSYSFNVSGMPSMGGLIRTEGDRMAVEALELSGGVGSQVSSFQSLAPEVSLFRVRYFDGRIWSEMWDSEEMGRIPRAVEISITFAPPQKKPPMFNVPVSKSMDTFRTVILIPVSDPYPQDFVQ